MQAVILAGGQGTRLRPVVSDVPKPLAPIGGRPFLAIVLDHLERQGVSDVILAVGYMGGAIERTLGHSHGAIALRYVYEDAPLGTGGALRKALAEVERFPVLAMNGDTYLDIDLDAMVGTHAAAAARLSVAVRHVDDTGRYGRVVVEHGRIIGFSRGKANRPGLINCGVYVFSENLLSRPDLPERFSFEKDFLERHVAEIAPLAIEARGYFIDIGVPEDYARAAQKLSTSRCRA